MILVLAYSIATALTGILVTLVLLWKELLDAAGEADRDGMDP